MAELLLVETNWFKSNNIKQLLKLTVVNKAWVLSLKGENPGELYYIPTYRVL